MESVTEGLETTIELLSATQTDCEPELFSLVLHIYVKYCYQPSIRAKPWGLKQKMMTSSLVGKHLQATGVGDAGRE